MERRKCWGVDEKSKSRSKKSEYQEQGRQIKEQFICGLDNEGMQTKIVSEIKAKDKTDNVTSEQVLMMAKQEEASLMEIIGAEQTNTKMIRTGTCRYCGSSHPPRRCPAYGVMCGECGRVNHFSAMCKATRQGMSRWEEQSKEQINKVKNNHFICHYKYVKASIDTLIKYVKASIDTLIITTSFYNSINIRYNLDLGRSNNSIPFRLYKKLFPKVTNKYVRQPKTCKLKLMQNGKEKMCNFL